jgi:hypothetical protein
MIRAMARCAFSVVVLFSLFIVITATALWLVGRAARPKTIECRRFSFDAMPDRTRVSSFGLSSFFGELYLSRTKEDWFAGAVRSSGRQWKLGKTNAPHVLFVGEIDANFNMFHRVQRRDDAVRNATGVVTLTGKYELAEEWGLLVPLWFVVVLFLVPPAAWLAVRRSRRPRTSRHEDRARVPDRTRRCPHCAAVVNSSDAYCSQCRELIES